MTLNVINLAHDERERALDRGNTVADEGLSWVANAVLFQGGSELGVHSVALVEPGPDDVVVDVSWSGVSTGTEKLLWSGDMPPFPGLTYPLVPGYEAVGKVVSSSGDESLLGQQVFVPGSKGFKGAAGLFGASASRLVCDRNRVVPIALSDPSQGVLLALAATANHAIEQGDLPELIVGHGVVGRLLARLCVALGGAPTVWEIDSQRMESDGYRVCHPSEDTRRDYQSICDVSGDANIIDQLLGRLAPTGEIVLAGFYAQRPSFSFPMAFMREMRLRVAAEWSGGDLDAVLGLINTGELSLDGLITHTFAAGDAAAAYRTAFTDSRCLKLILDWRAAT